MSAARSARRKNSSTPSTNCMSTRSRSSFRAMLRRRDIPGLVERLRSRFEWGLIADIQPPDLETKMAILDKKAEAEGVKLPDDVRTFMADEDQIERARARGRPGEADRLLRLTGTPINMPMAQQVLKHLVHVQERRDHHRFHPEGVADDSRSSNRSSRKRATRKEDRLSAAGGHVPGQRADPGLVPEIGRAFGGKHHTTVIHSIDKIDAAAPQGSGFEQALHSLMDSLQ